MSHDFQDGYEKPLYILFQVRIYFGLEDLDFK